MLESFQGAPQEGPVTLAQCAATALRSFPVKLGETPTDTLYESVLEPITMDIQWGSRSIAPSYSNPAGSDGRLDEVGSGVGASTTIRYRGKLYTLESVQLTAPSHSEWILPRSEKAANQADCILTFETSADVISYKYIVIVAPLLFTSAGSSSPDYLRGLADSSSTGPFTLRSLLPGNTNALFAYYSTCLNGYTNNASTENAGVFISVTGTRVEASLMETIKTNRRQINYPAYEPPFTTRLTSGIQQTIGGTFPFTGYVQTTNELLDYAAASSRYRNIGTIQREDSLDSYKCVPLDPDKNIEDGKIRVNADTGELLTDVVKEREIVRAADSTKGGMEPGRLEKYLGTALGVILAVILFGSIGYFVYTLFISTGSSKVLPISGAAAAAAAAATVAPGPPTEESWVQKIPMYGLLTLIAGFIGFIIGAMLS